MTRVKQIRRNAVPGLAWSYTGRTWIGLRTRGAVLLTGMILSAAGCPEDAPIIDEMANREAAKQLTANDRGAAQAAADQGRLHLWREDGPAKPVELYVDLSQSMRGFLDDQFYTDAIRYRAVIDMLDAQLRPTPIYGFGSTVRVAGERASTLGNRGIYSDGNTQMEDVFPRIEGDSGLGASHLIIGDGRRADPNLANDQYVRMRQVAAEWITRGGTFAVAASLAPFKPVNADPSGCRVREHEKEEEEGEGNEDDAARCPLYAFAFIAAGDEARVAGALAERFEHLFVIPAPAADERAVMFRQVAPVQPTQGIMLEPAWVQRDGGGFVARVRADTFTMNPLETELVVAPSDSPAGRALAASLAGQGVRAELYARRLHGPPTDKWEQVSGLNQLVIPSTTPFRWRIVSRGENAERIAYRIDLVPTGVPTWLSAFDADTAGDPLRTYGMGRLFQGFHGAAVAPVLRAFVVVN